MFIQATQKAVLFTMCLTYIITFSMSSALFGEVVIYFLILVVCLTQGLTM